MTTRGLSGQPSSSLSSHSVIKEQQKHENVVLIRISVPGEELKKRADRADQWVLFFLAGANFWEKHAKNRRKHAKTRENWRKTGAFLVLIFWGGKLVGANFYAFCNYSLVIIIIIIIVILYQGEESSITSLDPHTDS